MLSQVSQMINPIIQISKYLNYKCKVTNNNHFQINTNNILILKFPVLTTLITLVPKDITKVCDLLANDHVSRRRNP